MSRSWENCLLCAGPPTDARDAVLPLLTKVGGTIKLVSHLITPDARAICYLPLVSLPPLGVLSSLRRLSYADPPGLAWRGNSITPKSHTSLNWPSSSRSSTPAYVKTPLPFLPPFFLPHRSEMVCEEKRIAESLVRSVEQVPMGYGTVKTLTDTSMRNCVGDMRAFGPTIMTG